MLKKVNNNKGFTLIELLAVIVILGVLMIIAVPMVTKYITSAKKDAFVDTAKAYINSARYSYLNGDYILGPNGNDTCAASIDSGSGGDMYVKFKYIDVDKTGGNSSFNKEIDKENSYVHIHSDADGKYTYYVAMRDTGKNGFQEKEESVLSKKDVVNTIESISIPTNSAFCSK